MEGGIESGKGAVWERHNCKRGSATTTIPIHVYGMNTRGAKPAPKISLVPASWLVEAASYFLPAGKVGGVMVFCILS